MPWAPPETDTLVGSDSKWTPPETDTLVEQPSGASVADALSRSAGALVDKPMGFQGVGNDAIVKAGRALAPRIPTLDTEAELGKVGGKIWDKLIAPPLHLAGGAINDLEDTAQQTAQRLFPQSSWGTKPWSESIPERIGSSAGIIGREIVQAAGEVLAPRYFNEKSKGTSDMAMGLGRSAGTLAESFASGEGIATLPFFATKVGRGIFFAKQVTDTPEQMKRMADTLKDPNKTNQEKWESIGDAAKHVAMTVGLALHMTPDQVKDTMSPDQAARLADSASKESALGGEPIRQSGSPASKLQLPTEPPVEPPKTAGTANKQLPEWVKEQMSERGISTGRMFNDIDLQNPSVIEGIKSDPTLSDEQKASLLKTGEMPKPTATPPQPQPETPPVVPEASPVKEGFVRMYHGGSDPTGELNGPRDITPYPEYASGYAAKSPGSSIWYVDVPNDAPYMKKAFEEFEGGPKSPFINTTAPADVMKSAKRINGDKASPVADTPAVAPVGNEAGRPVVQGQPETTQPTGQPDVSPVVKPVRTGGGALGRFHAETAQVGEDILSWIQDNMRMTSKSAAKAIGKEYWQRNGSSWDDAQPLRAPHHNVIYGGKSRPDQVAQAAFEAGMIKEPSVPALWETINRASETRANLKKGRASEAAQQEHAIAEDEVQNAGAHSDVSDIPQYAPTEDDPFGLTPPKPQLKRGEKQGDLISSTQKEDLSLSGEKGTDFERVQAAKAKAAKDAAEAKAIADKQQLDIFNAKPADKPVVDQTVKKTEGQADQRYRIGKSPQTHTIVKEHASTPAEQANGEEYVDIKNDKTGEIQKNVLKSELQAVKSKQPLTGKPNNGLGGKLGGLGMGNATDAEFSMPTMEDLISGEPLASERSKIDVADREPESKSVFSKIYDAMENLTELIPGFGGKTFPKTTRADRQLGEAGARWVSARIAAKPKAEIFVADVLGNSGLSARDVGAALTEDNLRSIRESFQKKGDAESASKVNSFVGSEKFPFKTEADYQAFLNDPRFKEVVNRFKDLWVNAVEPQYKVAMDIDPETELPSRGLQTGARINLRAWQEGENPKDVVRGVTRGNLTGTMKRKSPFGVQAKGTGQDYHVNLYDIMENTFGKQDEIAAKNRFDNMLVEKGQAVIAKPGQKVIIGGQPAVPFPLKRSKVVIPSKEGTTVTGQNENIYVNKKLAQEYRIGANVDFKPPPSILQGLNKVLNAAAISGATDATAHSLNLISALATLPGSSGKLLHDSILSALPGRPDAWVAIGKVLTKGFQDNRAQLASLAEIGALREPHPPSALGRYIPPVAWASKSLQWLDKSTRLALDDAFKNLAKQGLVDATETSRREFVNQIGQYNSRAQGYYKRLFRETGLGPFVTAGTTFNNLGVRALALSPGVKGSSAAATAALRANMAAKIVGSAGTVMLLNYILTKDKGGGVGGRPGTPIGAIDTGTNDKNGRPQSINIFNMIGPGRGLRVTGLRGFAQAKMFGLPTGTALDSAGRDAVNSAISPWAGPPVRFGLLATTGYPASVGIGRQLPVVPPGQSQRISDFKNAVVQASPLTAGIQKSMEQGSGGLSEIVKSQLPRFTPQPGRPIEMMQDYPGIVRRAQANGYIEDVIGRARKMEPVVRMEFLKDSIGKLDDAKDREHAVKEFKRRKLIPY